MNGTDGTFDLRLDIGDVVAGLCREAQDRQAGNGERLVNEGIPPLTLLLSVAGVIELDREQRSHCVMVAKHEVDVLSGNAVEVRLPSLRGLGHPEQISEAYLGEKPVVISDGAFENTEERALGLILTRATRLGNSPF